MAKTIRRRDAKRTPRTKKLHRIDGKVYNSKALCDYHRYLAGLAEDGLIKSFSLPEADEMVKSKYHAVKAVINGIEFDSLNESRYYTKLLLAIRDGSYDGHGRFESFDMQVPYVIVPSYLKNGHRIRRMEYVADFVLHYKDGRDRVIDVKGIETDVFRLKKKFVEYVHPDVVIECLRYVPAQDSFMTLKEYKACVKARKAKKAA